LLQNFSKSNFFWRLLVTLGAARSSRSLQIAQDLQMLDKYCSTDSRTLVGGGVKLLDLTLPSPAANLALDEALLEELETAAVGGEFGQLDWNPAGSQILRLWEMPQIAVVLGRGSRVDQEVDLPACRRDKVPVLRRSSGGSTVLVGPGCLLYSVVLSYRQHPELRRMEALHRWVVGRLLEGVAIAAQSVAADRLECMAAGVCDGVWQGRKVSGNALRCRRHWLLYHGTLLYDFPVDLMGRYLLQPPRQPAYREGRSHDDFVTQLPLSGEQLRDGLTTAWEAREPLAGWPQAATAHWLTQRHASLVWQLEGKTQRQAT
jgi:lipoate-protein ligase A